MSLQCHSVLILFFRRRFQVLCGTASLTIKDACGGQIISSSNTIYLGMSNAQFSYIDVPNMYYLGCQGACHSLTQTRSSNDG